ncbi:MAG: carbohydrate porin [Pirellula sp.]
MAVVNRKMRTNLRIAVLTMGSVIGPTALAQEPSEIDSNLDSEGMVVDPTKKPELALPKLRDKASVTPENSLPKQSQPNRDSMKQSKVRAVRTSAQSVPGHPSRNLDIPSTVEEANETQCDELAEPTKPLFWVFPRELRGGGLTFECVYTGETFTKAKGGLNSGHPTNYRSNLDVVAIADTGKLGWWDRGRFFVYGQNLSGRPISTDEVGDFQLFSNLDSTIGPGRRPNFTAVSEYWFEQYFADETLSFRVGKQDTNAIFALTDLGGEFVHSSYGAPPIIPMPTFPSNALGLSCFYKLAETTTLGFGIYDGTLADGPQGVRWGFDTLGHNGAFSIYQAEFKPQFGSEGEFPMTMRVGFWRHENKDDWTEITLDPNPRTFGRNHGFFITGDQMIWKENGAEDDQGLGVFVQYFSSPSNRNVIDQYLGGGLVYKGLLAGRDEDYVGLGFAKAIFSDPFRAQEAVVNNVIIEHSETAVETFYKWFVRDSFSVQPDLQYIARPSGQHRDALVAGLRFEVVF